MVAALSLCKNPQPGILSTGIRLAVKNRTIQNCHELVITDILAKKLLAEEETGDSSGAGLLAGCQFFYPGVQSISIRVTSQNILVQARYKFLDCCTIYNFLLCNNMNRAGARIGTGLHHNLCRSGGNAGYYTTRCNRCHGRILRAPGGNGSTGVIGKTQCHALTCVQVYILILKRNPIPAAAGAVIAIDRNRAVMRILNRISCLAAVNHISTILDITGIQIRQGLLTADSVTSLLRLRRRLLHNIDINNIAVIIVTDILYQDNMRTGLIQRITDLKAVQILRCYLRSEIRDRACRLTGRKPPRPGDKRAAVRGIIRRTPIIGGTAGIHLTVFILHCCYKLFQSGIPWNIFRINRLSVRKSIIGNSLSESNHIAVIAFPGYNILKRRPLNFVHLSGTLYNILLTITYIRISRNCCNLQRFFIGNKCLRAGSNQLCILIADHAVLCLVEDLIRRNLLADTVRAHSFCGIYAEQLGYAHALILVRRTDIQIAVLCVETPYAGLYFHLAGIDRTVKEIALRVNHSVFGRNESGDCPIFLYQYRSTIRLFTQRECPDGTVHQEVNGFLIHHIELVDCILRRKDGFHRTICP